MEVKSNKVVGVKLFKELQTHTKQINDIIYIAEKKIVTSILKYNIKIITASADGSCKLFDLQFKQLKHLNFRESIDQKQNLSMRGLW